MSGARRVDVPLGRGASVMVALLAGLLLVAALTELGLRTLVPRLALLDPEQDAFWLQRRTDARLVAATDRDTVPDAQLGWRMKPGFRADGVTHTQKGFRGAQEPAAQAKGLRILAIGDSFTYGLGVRDDETFAARIGKLTGAEVINAGVNAYGVDQSVLLWEAEGRQLRPDIVLLSYYVDDFYRIGLSVRDRPKPHFVLDPSTGQFALRAPQESSHGTEHWRTTEALHWLRKRLTNRWAIIDESELRAKARLSEFLLARLKASVTQAGARLVVVYIGHTYAGVAEHQWIEASVLASCSALGIECLSLASTMRGPDWGRYYAPNAHFTVQGNEEAAQQIVRTLGLPPAAHDVAAVPKPGR